MRQLTDEQKRIAVSALKRVLLMGSASVHLPADSWIEKAFVEAMGEAQPEREWVGLTDAVLDAKFEQGFQSGLKSGWNYCIEDDQAGFQKAQSSSEYLRVLKEFSKLREKNAGKPAADDKAGGEPVAYVNKATLEEVRSQGGAMFVTLNSSAEFADEVPLYTATQPQSEAGRVPDGWKLVPVEPTPEMVKYAMLECGGIGSGSCGEYLGVDGDDMRIVYSAMLDAAPKL